jgi:hypothetical protein
LSLEFKEQKAKSKVLGKCSGEVYEPSPKDGVLTKYKTSKV